jgi:hypothetical protein
MWQKRNNEAATKLRAGGAIIILCSSEQQEDYTTAALRYSFNNTILCAVTAINRDKYYACGRVLFSLICEPKVSNLRDQLVVGYAAPIKGKAAPRVNSLNRVRDHTRPKFHWFKCPTKTLLTVSAFTFAR